VTQERATAGFDEVMRERWSCRGFLPDPVPQTVLLEAFEVAQQTASWCNTQPWHAHLLGGEALQALSGRLVEAVTAGAYTPDLPMPTEFPGVYGERRRQAGYALYEALGIAREDRPARAEQMLKNFTFFGAPHAAVITSDRAQGTYAHIDTGAYVGNLMHALTARGVATCAQAAIAMQSAVVREVLGLPDDRVVVCGMAIGYADPEHPANRIRIPRGPVEGAVTVVTEAPTSR